MKAETAFTCNKKIYPFKCGPLRTKEKLLKLGEAADKSGTDSYEETLGVKSKCIFYLLPYWEPLCFNIDIMHIIENIIKQFVVLMKGERKLQSKKIKDTATQAAKEKIERLQAADKKLEQELALEKKELEKMEELYTLIKAPTGIMPNTVRFCKWTGKLIYFYPYCIHFTHIAYILPILYTVYPYCIIFFIFL